MTDTIAATKIADMIIDDETGEVIEWPEGIADIPQRLMFLTAKKRECTEQENAWKSRGAFLGKLARELMEAQGIDRFTSETGRLLIQTRETRKADAERVLARLRDAEVPEYRVVQFVMLALESFNPDRMTEAAVVLGGAADLLDGLIETTSTTFVTAKAAPKFAPKAEKVEVEA